MQGVPHAAGDTVKVADGVHLTALAAGERMSLQHFHYELGATVPAHSHDHEQVGYVTGGTFTFHVDGEEFVIGPGDSYAIPAEQRHRAENRSSEPVRGVDVFSPPRDRPVWQD